ncbi:MAG: hypothetical protein PHO02_04620 [Candidatus Nanoarchaeia archaeon]|nr:hypothetical protein [Candidatus Nanoarchaeia archaeon]
MGCECAKICKNNPDKKFSELIEMGLICKTCASNYKEFTAMLDEEEKIGVKSNEM